MPDTIKIIYGAMTSGFLSLKGNLGPALFIGSGRTKFKKKKFSNKEADKAYKFIIKYRVNENN